MKYRVLQLALLLTVLLFAAGCNRDDRASDGRTAELDSSGPDSEASGVMVHLYDRGQVTAIIKADKFVKYTANDSTMAYGVDADSYDSVGNVATHVSGDSAIIRENEGFLTIYGNVVVVSNDNRRLETDYLNWESKTDRIFTDAFVRITTAEESVRGWGMEADQQIRRYKILHRVSGEVENTEKLQEEMQAPPASEPPADTSQPE